MKKIKLDWGEQTRIARGVGYSQQTINAIFTGQRRPSWNGSHGGKKGGAKRLAKFTGTDPTLWLEGTPAEIVAAIETARDRMLCSVLGIQPNDNKTG